MYTNILLPGWLLVQGGLASILLPMSLILLICILYGVVGLIDNGV
jgi:hypothetical protein